jgi:K+-transporting ATPase c subunit
MWLSFVPNTAVVHDPTAWLLDVMVLLTAKEFGACLVCFLAHGLFSPRPQGSPVSPYDVMINGSRHLHAVWTGARYSSQPTWTTHAHTHDTHDTQRTRHVTNEKEPKIREGRRVPGHRHARRGARGAG